MTKERIRVENIIKLFGESAQAGLKLLQAGRGKDEIHDETGAVLGLDNVSFTVNEGEILVVMGLSGSGKSTMLRCINRLIEPTSGSIKVDGTEVTTLTKQQLVDFRREKFGMVFQHFALFPNRTIAENVEYGLEVQGVARKIRRQKALEAIELVGLKGWADKLPGQLSGGMQQRAGLARALAVNADILLMDEAFSALDPLIRRDMQDELGTLQRNLKKTVVFVSHDLDEAIHLGGRIVLMKDGAIVQSGYPEEILLNPQGDYVRRFVEHIDVSSVVTLGYLASRGIPGLFEQSKACEAYPIIQDKEGQGFIVTCDRNMPVGRVSRDALSATTSQNMPLASLMLRGVQTAPARTILKEVLPKLAQEPEGIAVVDDDGRYLGLITQSAALRAISGSTGIAETHELTGETPWIGQSPNSRWTDTVTSSSAG
ncbi:glycine betaine/L-proline ABC transporter ATP-binding protein [Aureimonas fodinaquatilis]|uniref:Quaternary amine transport ATP-binding protein n=1 Tax=Aureimonas fodinaquatilis TaxID=2565783 RepID=A0A5B0DNL0_9HYPH|nr:glycine betaine/L-proline ABC transporter ATP-binding protein [Aureimonas fodinaquatilis]KAA0968467.1 glycine betaine/L-proline ABC transporter ATP-binding protein [Aureimonas fodinaquatilis]